MAPLRKTYLYFVNGQTEVSLLYLEGHCNWYKWFKGQNVALWKQTNQSSTYIYSHSYTSDKAVDGSDSRHNFSHNSCTHTIPGQQGDVWWKVDLGNFYSVMSILIANRYESNSNELQYVLYSNISYINNLIIQVTQVF